MATKAKPATKKVEKAEPKKAVKPEPKKAEVKKVAPKAKVETKKTAPKAAPKTKKVEAKLVPEYGKKYIFTSAGGEFIGSLSKGDPFDKMTIYSVANGVVTDRTIDVPDVSAYTFVDDQSEIFRRLA